MGLNAGLIQLDFTFKTASQEALPEEAQQLVRAWAEKITDEKDCQTFLENVAINRALMAAEASTRT